MNQEKSRLMLFPFPEKSWSEVEVDSVSPEENDGAKRYSSVVSGK